MATTTKTRTLEIVVPLGRNEALTRLREVAAGVGAELEVDGGLQSFVLQMRDPRIRTMRARGEIVVVAKGTRLTLALPRPRAVGSLGVGMGLLGAAGLALLGVLLTLPGGAGMAMPLLMVLIVGLVLTGQQRSQPAALDDRPERLGLAFMSASTALLPPVASSLRQRIPDQTDRCFLWGPAPGSRGLELDVRHGHVYPMGRALGVQDVSLGDGPFDDRFVVKTNDPDFACAWLNAPLRAELLALVDHVAFTLVEERLRVEELTPMVDGEQRLRALALAERLSRRGRGLLDEWRALAGRLGGQVSAPGDVWVADGSASVTLDRRGSTVVVDALADLRPLVTRLRCRRLGVSAGDDEAFDATWLAEVLAGDDRLVGGVALAQLVRACVPLEVRLEAAEAVVLLAGFVAGAERLAAAADLAVALAERDAGVAAPRGPYR
jgi:hypothetical protein